MLQVEGTATNLPAVTTSGTWIGDNAGGWYLDHTWPNPPQPTYWYYPWWGLIRPFPTPPEKHPFKCPVCEGAGRCGYGSLNDGKKCRPCKGKGIVWGPPKEAD